MKQKQDHWAKNSNTPNITIDTNNKNKGQRVNNEYNEQCQHNFEVQKKIKDKNIVKPQLMLLLLFIVCFCCILVVVGCVLCS